MKARFAPIILPLLAAAFLSAPRAQAQAAAGQYGVAQIFHPGGVVVDDACAGK